MQHRATYSKSPNGSRAPWTHREAAKWWLEWFWSRRSHWSHVSCDFITHVRGMVLKWWKEVWIRRAPLPRLVGSILRYKENCLYNKCMGTAASVWRTYIDLIVLASVYHKPSLQNKAFSLEWNLDGRRTMRQAHFLLLKTLVQKCDSHLNIGWWTCNCH